MNKYRFLPLLTLAFLLPIHAIAQVAPSVISAEIAASSANSLPGGTILNNIVTSYVPIIGTPSGLTIPNATSIGIGASQTAFGQLFPVTAAYAGLNSSNDIARIAVGGFPVVDEFGSIGFITSAVVGAVKTPSGTFSGTAYFDAGVAGYAQTANATRGAVGIFGEGAVLGNTGSAWGINTEAINCENHNLSCGPGGGLDFTKLISNEADVSVFTKSGGVAPAGNAYGYQASIFANTPISGNFIAFYATNSGIAQFGGSAHNWDIGFATQDGSVTTAMEIGATATGTPNVGSQPLAFNWFNGSTVLGLVKLNADNVGNLDLNAPLLISTSTTGGTPVQLSNTSTGGKTWGLYSSGSSSTGGAGKFFLSDITDAVTPIVIGTSGGVGIIGINTAGPVAPLHVHTGTDQNLLVQSNSGLTISANNDANNANVPLNINTTTLTLNGSMTATGSIFSKATTSGVGYTTGAGGAVTQLTSRTTGVTLNNVTGAITLVSAAGSATTASFTVTNSAVAATDTIIVNQKTGTDLYEIFVTNVAAGSFRITFFTTGGTTTEQPVFNFAIIKGSAN